MCGCRHNCFFKFTFLSVAVTSDNGHTVSLTQKTCLVCFLLDSKTEDSLFICTDVFNGNVYRDDDEEEEDDDDDNMTMKIMVMLIMMMSTTVMMTIMKLVSVVISYNFL